MSSAPTFLGSSLKQLCAITNEAYNKRIRQVALDIWEKHLQPDNPQWKFIIARPFYVKDGTGTAHVMAMVDKRLPGIGIVGYFACTNSESGAKVLKQASEWLKEEHGLRNVYGPINGTLPSDYRLNLNDDFCFPGEPVNPLWHIDAFNEAGFEIFNRYVSGISRHYQLLMRLVIRKVQKEYSHISVRTLYKSKLEQDFKTYNDLRNAIFPNQSIYCPAISLTERKYISAGKFDPKYTYFLLDGTKEIGFVMAYVYKKQLILKTIGILPDYQGKHLSSLLLKPIHDQAQAEGLRVAIYGMVRVGNAAYKMRRPGVRVFRRYVTMHKKI